MNLPTNILKANGKESYYAEVHTILSVANLTDIHFVEIKYGGPKKSEYANRVKKLLAESSLVDESNIYNGSKWRMKWSWTYNTYNFYPYNARFTYMVDWAEDDAVDHETYSFRRNSLLLNTPGIKVSSEHIEFGEGRDKPQCEGLLRGWTIKFSYNGVYYSWEGMSKIHVSQDSEYSKLIRFADGKDYQILGDDGRMSQEQFLRRLDEIRNHACTRMD